MSFPAKSVGPITRAVYSDYFSSRLTKAGFLDLANSVDAATEAMIAAHRRVEDLERPVNRRVAGRDLADEELDDAARVIRRQLACRSADAMRRTPYILIFPKGVEFYTEAKLEEQQPRYLSLVERLTSFLPDTDTYRQEAVSSVQTKLNAWLSAEAGVTAARTALDLARTERDLAVAAWQKAVETAFGQVMGRVGKAAANRFLPRNKRKAAKGDADAPPPATEEPSADPPETPDSDE